MNKFYNDKEDISIRYLLEATPFNIDNRINFSHKLTPEIFFEEFFVKCNEDIENPKYNDIIAFNKRFNKILSESLNNSDSKVNMIHLQGYAGCGKTTLVQHVLWEQYKTLGKYYLIDFDGEDSIEQTLCKVISELIFNDINQINKSIIFSEKLNNISEYFETRRLCKDLKYLNSFINELTCKILSFDDFNQITLKDISNIFTGIKKQHQYDDYALFLMQFYFIYKFIEYIINGNGNNNPLIIVFDNTDSITNLEEEEKLIPKIKGLIDDWNFFITTNSFNDKHFYNNKISSSLKDFKMLCFLTTRRVTKNKYKVIQPNMEQVYSWHSFIMPENYYSHIDIINKKVSYYLKNKNDFSSKKIKELIRYNNFANLAYKTNLLTKLFNGNIRFCLDVMYNLLEQPSQEKIINEFIASFNKISTNSDKVNGYLIRLIFDYFIANNVLNDKLHLSSINDHQISLSRIILTIIREKDQPCSIKELFECLSSIFEPKFICDTIYDLSEIKREIWRRLIIFKHNFPEKREDLYKQIELFNNHNIDLDKYTSMEISNAGDAYISSVVPHFEFILCRLNMEENSRCIMQNNSNYLPLYSDSSEDIINDDENKFRFERKIDLVYNAVKILCEQSYAFAKNIVKQKDLTFEEYVNDSVYCYCTKNIDGTLGNKQSYGSRLIFSQFGYIERYRRYLIDKNKDKPADFLIDINKRLIEKLRKYLQFYNEDSNCIHTDSQDQASKILLQKIEVIESSNYNDFNTRIETN